jgi:signal transduction histidine kinase
VYASFGLRVGTAAGPSFRLKSSLAQQFLLVAFCVVLAGMFAMGALVSRRIERGVAQVKAASAALYINNFIAPHLQELASGDTLSETSVKNLHRVLDRPAVRSYVTSVKIWKENGLIVYSSEPDLIGKRFPANPNPRKAWSGTIVTEFDDLYHEEDARDRATGLPLLEVYAPIRDTDHGNVIAVVEFHEHAEALKAELAEAEWQSWVSTALITIAMMGVLFSVVAKGSRTIDEQRVALTERIAQLSELLQQNRLLRTRVERAARNATEDNERHMRRLGYDLHDGIAQLIGLALLRLDRVQGTENDRDNLKKIHKALSDAIGDIRNLYRGLLLPEVQNFTLGEALIFMIRQHERRTGSSVTCHIADLPDEAPQFVKIALCRFVQEGLNNAFKHADGKDQRVGATWDGKTVTIEVADKGPGMAATQESSAGGGLGLVGLRDRMESIGGELIVEAEPGSGTRLLASLPLGPGVSDAE